MTQPLTKAKRDELRALATIASQQRRPMKLSVVLALLDAADRADEYEAALTNISTITGNGTSDLARACHHIAEEALDAKGRQS